MTTDAEVDPKTCPDCNGTGVLHHENYPYISYSTPCDLCAATRITELLVTVAKYREALEDIIKTGTPKECTRVGDMYAEDGYMEYTIVSEEAMIACEVLEVVAADV